MPLLPVWPPVLPWRSLVELPLPVPDCVPVPLALPPLPVWPLVLLVPLPVCATAPALISTAVITATSLVFMFAPQMDDKSGHFFTAPRRPK
jgi:hypothetical protein